ncbi:MAG: hypothetical protein AYK23_00475 [Candidatus Proteinoplasmatales archaeon SG8-5]|nr:MAG: hypothetical protein AYK23_00475 [Candidatus Proteinoplasmatales archaeon SG8-5]
MASRKSIKREGGAKCEAAGCENEGSRSLSRKKVESSVEFSLDGEGKKVSLCKDHYRKFKKATKEERKLDSLGR